MVFAIAAIWICADDCNSALRLSQGTLNSFIAHCQRLLLTIPNMSQAVAVETTRAATFERSTIMRKRRVCNFSKIDPWVVSVCKGCPLLQAHNGTKCQCRIVEWQM